MKFRIADSFTKALSKLSGFVKLTTFTVVHHFEILL